MTNALDRPAYHPLLGIGCCILGLLGFAVQDTLVKTLSQRYPVLEVLAARSIAVLAILLLVGLLRNGLEVLRCAHAKLMVLRGSLAFLAFGSYYLALTKIPLADAAAVYMTAPLFVTALSVPLLGERVGWHRWLAVSFGFAAALVMLAPGTGMFNLAAALPLFSALNYSMIPIITRRIGLAGNVLTITIYTTASFLALCLVAGALVYLFPYTGSGDGLLARVRAAWQPMTGPDATLTVLAALVFAVALVAITQAYRIAAVSAVAPFEYSYLVWAILLGYLAFGDLPQARTVLGGVAVVSCGCYVMYRERLAAKALVDNRRQSESA